MSSEELNKEVKGRTLPCRYCKQPVSRGDKRCPHCGTFNPSMDVKRTMVWTIGVVAVLYVVAFVLQMMRGE